MILEIFKIIVNAIKGGSMEQKMNPVIKGVTLNVVTVLRLLVFA